MDVFPPEVILTVFRFLTMHELVNIMLVSRVFQVLAKGDLEKKIVDSFYHSQIDVYAPNSFADTDLALRLLHPFKATDDFGNDVLGLSRLMTATLILLLSHQGTSS
jgi:hypothetical protein